LFQIVQRHLLNYLGYVGRMGRILRILGMMWRKQRGPTLRYYRLIVAARKAQNTTVLIASFRTDSRTQDLQHAK